MSISVGRISRIQFVFMATFTILKHFALIIISLPRGVGNEINLIYEERTQSFTNNPIRDIHMENMNTKPSVNYYPLYGIYFIELYYIKILTLYIKILCDVIIYNIVDNKTIRIKLFSIKLFCSRYTTVRECYIDIVNTRWNYINKIDISRPNPDNIHTKLGNFRIRLVFFIKKLKIFFLKQWCVKHDLNY